MLEQSFKSWELWKIVPSHNLLSKRRNYVPCSKLLVFFSCEWSHPWQGESIATLFAIASSIGPNDSSTSTPTSITLFLHSIIIKIIIFYINIVTFIVLDFPWLPRINIRNLIHSRSWDWDWVPEYVIEMQRNGDNLWRLLFSSPPNRLSVQNDAVSSVPNILLHAKILRKKSWSLGSFYYFFLLILFLVICVIQSLLLFLILLAR